MHEQSRQYARKWFDNEFLETIYSKFNSGNTKQGDFAEIVNKNYLHSTQQAQ